MTTQSFSSVRSAQRSLWRQIDPVNCIIWAGIMLATVAFWIAVLSAVAQHGQAIIDFVAPTAAQARDIGWAALAEGR